MNTPSHFLMTAALRKALPRLRIPASAVLLGSIAPDLPLFALYFGARWWFIHVEGWEPRRAFGHIFGDLYFNDPAWIALHNSLHAPLIVIAGTVGFTLLLRRRTGEKAARRFNWLRWFFAACLLHSYVDIFTHHDDGPLVFFPFDWSYRYPSPLSYWDSNHFATIFAPIEAAFDVLMLAYLVLPLLWRLVKRPFAARRAV